MTFTSLGGRIVLAQSENLAELEQRPNAAFLSDALSAWEQDPFVRLHPRREQYEQNLRQLFCLLEKEQLSEILPSPEKRPILLAGVIDELTALIASCQEQGKPQLSRSELRDSSPLLRILDVPYSPIFMDSILGEIQAHIASGGRFDFSWFEEHLPGRMNSSFRNIFIAQQLADTVMNAGGKGSAELQLATYSWGQYRARVTMDHGPDLPDGTDQKQYVKAIVCFSLHGLQHHADYGASEGKSRYGIHPTGEGIGSVVGMPLGGSTINPHDFENLIYLLSQVRNSQDTGADREAVRRLRLHSRMTSKLVDYMSAVPVGASPGQSFPGAIIGAHDLFSPAQGRDHLKHTLQFAALVREMWEQPFTGSGKTVFRDLGTVFSLFRGRRALIDMGEPSTRTASMADTALRALGLGVVQLDHSKSSDAKGEGYSSKLAFLKANGLDAWLMRGAKVDSGDLEHPSIGVRILRDQERDESTPTLLSLGGTMGHPTQTCGEIMTFMDHFSVEDFSMETLAEVTSSNPPTITWMGHTGNKRADKGLIRFIREHLPHWQVRVVVPDEAYVPQFDFSGDDNYQLRAVDDLLSPERVAATLKGSDFVYISNPVNTSAGSTGVEKTLQPDYQLSTEVLEILEKGGETPLIMAPLPGGREIDDEILSSARCLAHEQMVNKIAFGISVIAHQFAAKDARRALRRAAGQ